jgi:hypothetical protein
VCACADVCAHITINVIDVNNNNFTRKTSEEKLPCRIFMVKKNMEFPLLLMAG